MPQLPARSTSATRLMGGTFCAITRFVERPSVELALGVARHLECMAEQTGKEDASLHGLCSLLAMRWRGWIPAHLPADPDADRH